MSLATDIKPPVLRSRLAGVRPFFIEELDSCCAFLGLTISELLARADSAEVK